MRFRENMYSITFYSPAPKCLMFAFSDINFDHSSYSKYEKIKYNVVYYLMYFKYIFDFFIFLKCFE
jgi:hypothetical protein